MEHQNKFESAIFQLSQMNMILATKQLKAAGIDTSSKKYKAALSEIVEK